MPQNKNLKKLKILLFGDPALRQNAKPVTVFHKKLHAFIDSLAVTLDSCEDGAALAATQVGELKSITVINYEGEYLELINPEIIEAKGEQTDYEGCLSYPGYIGKVKRAETIKVKYVDRFGKENVIERTNKMARCIQHEIDHLNGILFIDRVKEDHLIHADSDTEINIEFIRELTAKNQ